MTEHGNPRVVNVQSFSPGLSLDGDRVGNLFVYDKAGNLIEGAQIYTNRGTPLDLVGPGRADVDSAAALFGPNEGGTTTVPFRDAQGGSVWNVYPLQLARVSDGGYLVPDVRLVPQPPFVRAPALVTTSPEPTGGATAAPSTAPTPPPTPLPSPTPTPAG